MIKKKIDCNGNEVTLSLGCNKFPLEPKHVLIISRYKNNWVLTRHKIRGLEFPGGKSESVETLEETAKRELYEETGARTSKLIRLGTYIVHQELPFAKAIFFAEIDYIEDKEDFLETEGLILWSGDFNFIEGDENFSFIMKDGVVNETVRYLYELSFF